MRFLAFVSNEAEGDNIEIILHAAGIPYEKELVKSLQGKTQGCVFRVPDEDFDKADECLNMPKHDMKFHIMEESISERRDRWEREKRVEMRRTKFLKHIARNMGILGILYLLYAFITR